MFSISPLLAHATRACEAAGDRVVRLQKEVVWPFLTHPCTPALLETQAQVHHLLHCQTLAKKANTRSLVLLNAASLADRSHGKRSSLKSLWSMKDPLRYHRRFEQLYAHASWCRIRPCVGRTSALQFSACRRRDAQSNGQLCRSLQILDSHSRPRWFFSIVI